MSFLIIAILFLLLLFVFFIILIAKGTSSSKHKEIKTSKDLKDEKAREIKKENEKIIKAQEEERKKISGVLEKRIKEFLMEKPGKLIDEVELRSSLVRTSSDDWVFYQAIQSLLPSEGFRSHIEYSRDSVLKTYYYYVNPKK